MLARTWTADRNTRGNRQGAAQLGSWLPRLLGEEANSLQLQRYQQQPEDLAEQLPRIERIQAWLHHARHVLDIPEMDRLYGELNKLEQLAHLDITDDNTVWARDEQRQWQLQHELFERMYWTLVDLPLPVIAAVNGPAIDAGLDLSCMCDIRIASETATFAESFVRVGIVPGDGGAWLLPRAVGMAKASEMAFTGEPISAQEALACGLVSRVVAADQLLPTARALAAKIAANPGAVMRMTKRLLREGQSASLASLLELSAGYQAIAHKTADHREAVTAFIEKRAPQFQ